ncbi:MAG: hypothetical protein U0350_28825 [Caldilineaceae bacterium]
MTMSTNLLTSIYLIYYEELWDVASPHYLPALIRHGYSKDGNRWGPFDPVALPLTPGWLEPFRTQVAQEPGLASFAPYWSQGRLEICGLSSIRPDGKPVFLDGLRRMVLPLRLEELIIRLQPNAADGPTTQVMAQDFHFKVIAGLCLGGPRLFRFDELQAGAGVWQASKTLAPIREAEQSPWLHLPSDRLSNQVITGALQILNHPDVRNSLGIFLNAAIRAVFASPTI